MIKLLKLIKREQKKNALVLAACPWSLVYYYIANRYKKKDEEIPVKCVANPESFVRDAAKKVPLLMARPLNGGGGAGVKAGLRTKSCDGHQVRGEGNALMAAGH